MTGVRYEPLFPLSDARADPPAEARGTARQQAGLTVVELLIAASIVIIVLAMVGVFLGQQAQVQRATQNRSELQDRVRVAMQLLTQDLALTGNSAVVANDGRKLDILWPGCFDGFDGCVELSDGGSRLKVRYLSSHFPAGSECRDVSYRLTGEGVLERSDVDCGGAETFAPLAENIVTFDVTVHCSNGIDLKEFPSAQCPPLSGYGRSATVEIVGQSRSPGSGLTAPGCDPDYLCFAMRQETLMPNMKDQ